MTIDLKQNKIKYILGISIFLFALIIAFFKKASNDEGGVPEEITKLPKFEIKDVRGNTLSSASFRGINSYIQFVDPLNTDDLYLIQKVFSEWKDENLLIAVFTTNALDFQKRSGMNGGDIVISDIDNERMKERFNSPANGGVYYMFNAAGESVNIGYSRTEYQRGAKVHLNRLVKNKHFTVSDLVEIKKNIRDHTWFQREAFLLDSAYKKHSLVSFFTSVCDTCPEGAIIQDLKRVHSSFRDTVYVLCVLSDDFSLRDVQNLQSQLKINFDVVVAEEPLRNKWNALIHEFGEDAVTNIVFLVDGAGKILQVLDKSCDCRKQFFNYVFLVAQDQEAVS